MFGRTHYAAIFFDTKNIKAMVDTLRHALYRVRRVHGHEDPRYWQWRARTRARMEIEAKSSGGARLVRPRERWDCANSGVRRRKSTRRLRYGGHCTKAQSRLDDSWAGATSSARN